MLFSKSNLLAACAVLSLGGMATPALAERPVEQFAQLPEIQGPALSPSGQMIAATLSLEGKEQLVVYPVAAGAGPTSQIALDDVNVASYFWVNDDWLLISVAQPDNSLGPTIVVSRLISFNVRTKEMIRIKDRQMGQSGADVIWIADDGSPTVLLAYQKSFYSSEIDFFPTVAKVDVSKNKFETVQTPRQGVFNWIVDPDGVVRVGLGSEKGGRQTRVLYRGPEGGTLREIGNTKDNENLPMPIAFLQDPGKAVGFSDKDGADAAYEIDLASMTLGEQLLAVKGYDLGSVHMDPSGRKVIGLRYVDVKPRTMWLDPDFAAIQSGLEQALGRDIAIASRSRDDTAMIVQAFGADRPSSYYLYDKTKRSLALLGHQNPEMVKAPLAPVKTVKYKARDGMALNAVLTLPPGKPATKLPVVILPHGGPGVRDYESWDWWSQFLADRGYAVIQPNYRGSTGFGNAFHEAGDGEWGMKMQDDVDDALAWAAEEGIVDAGRACVAGASYGGYVAMRAAQRNPELYRCAISFAGVSDLDKMLVNDRRFYNEMATVDYWKGRTPDLKAVSPFFFADKVGMPILVMHGRKDLRVPVAQSRDYASALRKAGKEVTYIEQKDGDHHFTRQADRLEFLQEIERFLDRHNPA